MGIGNVIFLVPGLGGAAPPFVFDEDALAYITAVETADTEELELGVKKAINSFVKGCKKDGIWDAIKASCILAGARTLAGALVPLKGSAPTNVDGNFVSGDYNRKTGLVGDGSTKYLDSNRNNNADGQNDKHGSVYVTTATTSAGSGTNTFPMYFGRGGNVSGSFHIGRSINNGVLFSRCHNSAENAAPANSGNATGLVAISRSSSANYIRRFSGSNATITETSQAPLSGEIFIFRNQENITWSNGRIAFYSIGEALDLAKLDTRVTNLINKFNSVI